MRLSLYMEWFILLLFAGMVSLLFFVVARFLFERQFDKYYRSRILVQSNNQKYVLQLQEYIRNQGISSANLDQLDRWMRDNRFIYVQIKDEDELLYTSDHYLDKAPSGAEDQIIYPKNFYHDMDLMDGPVQVLIMKMYSYNAYFVALVLDIVISCVLFIVITMLGIRGKIHYINQLSRDIEILEGGNLDYEVHVRGNDEIAEMAKGLNAMKISFHNQIDEVERLKKTNQEMVTEISHDLRTPLTSVLLYAEIIKNEKYKNEEDKRKIIDKMIRKIQHMKELSDGLLAYAVRVSEERYVPVEYISVQGVFFDGLSDMCQYLLEQGLTVTENLKLEKGQILACEEYLTRVMDNISSNILKYADRREGVLVWDECDGDEMCIFWKNACVREKAKKEGYHIGIRNIRTMMREMGGQCDVVCSDESFCICLKFKFRREE